MVIGRRIWAIPEGCIPAWSHGPGREMVSHEAACLLNANTRSAEVRLTIYFSDREPVGPYRIVVPAQRTIHLRFNDLRDPAPIPLGVDFSSIIESDQPIVVQHTRLDSRQSENALMTTIAFAADSEPGTTSVNIEQARALIATLLSDVRLRTPLIRAIASRLLRLHLHHREPGLSAGSPPRGPAARSLATPLRAPRRAPTRRR